MEIKCERSLDLIGTFWKDITVIGLYVNLQMTSNNIKNVLREKRSKVTAERKDMYRNDVF